jgi:hypothetical protein
MTCCGQNSKTRFSLFYLGQEETSRPGTFFTGDVFPCLASLAFFTWGKKRSHWTRTCDVNGFSAFAFFCITPFHLAWVSWSWWMEDSRSVALSIKKPST